TTVLSLPPDRITVIPLAPRWPGPMTPAPARLASLPEIYFLHLGNLEPRKNLLVLLDAWQLLPARLQENAALVLAGPLGSGDAAYWATLRDHPAAPAVRVAGYLGDRDVHALLTGATALLAPSRYEGFGLPILEAMACDTCVIHSSAGAYPEVAADAASSVDPDDVDGWAATIHRTAEDSAWRAGRILAGRRRTAEFSWQRTAANHARELSAFASNHCP
ncbi:MAG: glycosyltransferase family 1 protein, partial [Planctomycetota bacterium]|nr:glycosyltransferase family 1 protein [Planctomycetota bacterium]